jgi:SAM-dependent methyltransferase
MRTLKDWFETPLGRLLSDAERKALDRHLDRWTGASLLQIGGFGRGRRVLRANTSRQWLVGDADAGPVDCLLRAEQLPFQSGSMDIVVLVHSLEFSSNPHGVLREAARVLAPEGHLLVLGFNPVSWWGLAHMLPALKRRGSPWNGRYYSSRRLRDWLLLLDLEVDGAEYCFYRPPLRRRRLQERLRPLERWLPRLAAWSGGVHLTVASKHVAGMTPLRPVWQSLRQFAAGGIAQPSSRKITDAALRRDI